MLESLKLLHNVLWSSTLMMGLCLASIGYLVYRGIKKQESVSLRICLLFTVLTGVLVCMNPILGKLLTRISGDKYTFIRLTWLLPVFALMAYAATRIILNFEGRKRFVACILVFGLILCAGRPWPSVYLKAENIYKVEDSLKDACDAIRTDCTHERPNVTVYIPDNNIYEDGSIANMRYFGVRQYAPEFVLDFTIVTDSQLQEENYTFAGNLWNMGEYVICPKNEVLQRELQRVGYELLQGLDDLAVFKNTVHMTIIFVRHGQTEANVNNVAVGMTESPLTSVGIEQAKAAGHSLKGVTIDAVYSSHLQRATETAQYVLQESGNDGLELHTTGYLADVNWGEAEGMSMDDIRRTYGIDPNVRNVFGPVEEEDFVGPIPNTNNLHDYVHNFHMNVQSAITECYVNGMNGGTILITGHSAAAQWMRYILPTTEMPDGLENASVSILHYECGAWSAETLNNTDYEEVAEIARTL